MISEIFFMKKILVVTLLLTVVSNVFSQSRLALNGYVKDAANGEALIGATILIKELNIGTVTNVYGFYSISLNPGQYAVEISYIGYGTATRNIELYEDSRLDIELTTAETQ